VPTSSNAICYQSFLNTDDIIGWRSACETEYCIETVSKPSIVAAAALMCRLALVK
jgi:hypothetical protein